VDNFGYWMHRKTTGLAIRAFARLEAYRLKTGISWFEAKQTINRQAVRAYLKNPPLILLTLA
jgi:putative transposase